MSTNFADILSKAADSIEAPKQLAPGKYLGTVKHFTTGESTSKKTPYVEFTFVVGQVVDVAPEYREEAEAAVATQPETKTTFYLTEKNLYRLVEFLEKDLGISASGRSIGDMIAQSQGASCTLIMDKETSKDGSREFINIKRTAPV